VTLDRDETPYVIRLDLARAVYRDGLLELHAELQPSRATGRRTFEVTNRHRVLENPDATPC
jgi:hypothetical protein